MTRIRRIFAAAAGLVVAGGLALGIALKDAGRSVVGRDLTCDEWGQVFESMRGLDSHQWFVAMNSGYVPPEAFGDKIIGECGNGKCVISPEGCAESIEYVFSVSEAAPSGWRVAKIYGSEYFLNSWRNLAKADRQIFFMKSWKNLMGECSKQFKGKECRELLANSIDCWKKPTGDLCRHGLLYGPGLGGVDDAGNLVECQQNPGDLPYPCSSLSHEKWAEKVTQEDLPQDDRPIRILR